jgi:hypothetical protein
MTRITDIRNMKNVVLWAVSDARFWTQMEVTVLFHGLGWGGLGLLAEHYVGPGSGLPTSLSAGMIALSIWWRWDLSDRPWFWLVAGVIAVLHLILIISIPWTTHWIPAVVSTPICIVDGLLILKIFNLGETLIDSP